MHIFIISQDNTDLAITEIISLLSIKHYKIIGNMLCVADLKNDSSQDICRLAYTKKALKVLFSCSNSAFKQRIASYDFSKVYKENFSIRIHEDKKSRLSEAEYAGFVWRSLEKKSIRPKVDLKDPKTPLEIILNKGMVYCCLTIWKNSEDFESRKAHLNPAPHPTGMHPKMARALVNILNSKEIIDPFCGSGGILIEAGLMGIKLKGYDIDKSMIERAKINLKHNNINSRLCSLKRMDATKHKEIKNIVTDLPYGKSSHASEELSGLYSKFIKSIAGKAVIVFPNFVDYNKILKENLRKRLIVRKVFEQYIHKTLTRKIVVIDVKMMYK